MPKNAEEIKKSIEELVDQALSSDTSEEKTEDNKTEDLSKAEDTDEVKTEENKTEENKTEDLNKGEMPKTLPENGGDDKIKSGTPFSEKPSDGKKKKMKKSIEELSEHLSDDELELVQAWREENSEDAEDVNVESITKSVNAAVKDQVDTLMKAISDRDETIKTLSEKVEKMASGPAYDKRTVTNLEPLEKGGESEEPTIKKAQVLDTMLELQKEGKGVRAVHVAEFESTGNISNPHIKSLVMNKLKSN
jgi:hypothetical protein